MPLTLGSYRLARLGFFSFLFLAAASQAWADLHCTGLKRELLNNDQTKETKIDLTPAPGQQALGVLQGQIEDRGFSVSPIWQTHDYLLNIAIAPDFTKGVIAAAGETSDHRIELSTVDGTLVYKIECIDRFLKQ